MATHAIYLEFSEDLITGTFLAAFKRFADRQGTPFHVYSDNGLNFVGASKILGQPTLQPYPPSEFKEKTAALQTTKGLTRHFILARVPHFGGIW